MSDGVYQAEPNWRAKIRAEAEEAFSVAEASAHVGVSPETMVKWIKQGKVDYTHRMDGTIRVHPESLRCRLVRKT